MNIYNVRVQRDDTTRLWRDVGVKAENEEDARRKAEEYCRKYPNENWWHAAHGATTPGEPEAVAVELTPDRGRYVRP